MLKIPEPCRFFTKRVDFAEEILKNVFISILPLDLRRRELSGTLFKEYETPLVKGRVFKICNYEMRKITMRGLLNVKYRKQFRLYGNS